MDIAAGIAKDYVRENKRPFPLDAALGLVSLVAAEGGAYDSWACRWLARWLTEPLPALANPAGRPEPCRTLARNRFLS